MTVDELEPEWLEVIPGVNKVDLQFMLKRIESGQWHLWRLPAPAKGIAVTYPYQGKLFIYYLRGLGLFGNLTREDLLQAAKSVGLSGLMAEAKGAAMVRILKSLGFVVTDDSPECKVLELSDGR